MISNKSSPNLKVRSCPWKHKVVYSNTLRPQVLLLKIGLKETLGTNQLRKTSTIQLKDVSCFFNFSSKDLPPSYITTPDLPFKGQSWFYSKKMRGYFVVCKELEPRIMQFGKGNLSQAHIRNFIACHKYSDYFYLLQLTAFEWLNPVHCNLPINC